MIYESRFWKADLLKISAQLKRRRRQTRWTDASFARLEKEIMLGAYAVRKLREARKLSDRFRNRQVKLHVCHSNGSEVDHFNRIDIDELYDLASPVEHVSTLDFVMNQIIHSSVFTPGFNRQQRLSALYFASREKKDRCCYVLKIDELATIFREVGDDYPHLMLTDRKKTGSRDSFRLE